MKIWESSEGEKDISEKSTVWQKEKGLLQEK